MNKVTDKIYIGDWVNANDPHFIDGNKITAVFNLCNHVNERQDGAMHVHYPVNDDKTCTPEQIYYAVRTLDDLCEEHDKVLIHCLAGVSRSVTVLAIYLAWKNKGSFENGLKYIQRVRPIINPNDHFLKIGPEVLKKLRGW